MNKFEIICLLVLVLPVIAIAITLCLAVKYRDSQGWTWCWHCGDYFNAWGDTCKIPLDGKVKQTGICGPCLRNEKQVNGYAKRHRN